MRLMYVRSELFYINEERGFSVLRHSAFFGHVHGPVYRAPRLQSIYAPWMLSNYPNPHKESFPDKRLLVKSKSPKIRKHLKINYLLMDNQVPWQIASEPKLIEVPETVPIQAVP